ncbi:MAG: DinB family protein [Anaerolineae bacterium]
METDRELRTQLARLLTVRQAHMDFEDAVADFPAGEINTRPPNCDYTFWHLLEHLRICQRDILDYIVAEDYHWPNFPDDLWPDRDATTDLAGWQQTIAAFLADRQQLVDLVTDPAVNLFAPLPNSGAHRHNILREINIIASHNAYHTGELGVLRQTLGLWPAGERQIPFAEAG